MLKRILNHRSIGADSQSIIKMQNTTANVDLSEKLTADVQENSTVDSQNAIEKIDEAYVEDATPVIDRAAERKLVRKQDLLILPLLGLGYLMGVLV